MVSKSGKNTCLLVKVALCNNTSMNCYTICYRQLELAIRGVYSFQLPSQLLYFFPNQNRLTLLLPNLLLLDTLRMSWAWPGPSACQICDKWTFSHINFRWPDKYRNKKSADLLMERNNNVLYRCCTWCRKKI